MFETGGLAPIGLPLLRLEHDPVEKVPVAESNCCVGLINMAYAPMAEIGAGYPPGFDKTKLGLRKVRLENYRGFLF